MAIYGLVRLLDGSGSLIHEVKHGSSTKGVEPIYGTPFADEFHSHLWFKHRALIACANIECPNTNNSLLLLF